jgi:transcription initiation factor TFIIIB Brf1 subunit/transcription initiation factor TFIIB
MSSLFDTTMTSETDSDDYCSFCKTTVQVKTDYSQGYSACLSCGMVLQRNMIDTTAEYRLFSEGDQGDKCNPTRVGGIYDFSRADGGLDLKVEGGKKCPAFDSMHRKLKSIGTKQFKNVQLNAAYFRGAVLLGKWADHLYLPDKIVNKTKVLFQTLKQDGASFKGFNIEGIAAALLWLTCKQEESQNLAISFTALAEVSNVSIDEIKRCYHKITGDLPAEFRAPTTASASSYGGRFARELQLSDEACASIERLEKNIIEKGFLEGKNPRSIGAITVHTICLLSLNKSDIKTLKEIVKVAELSETTVKKHFKQYLKDIVKVVPECEGMKDASTLIN